MTRDDIIRMVEESGLDSILREWLHEFTIDSWVDAEIPELERFAALVAAVEREACAKICESLITEGDIYPANFVLENCAKTIRARNE